MPPLYYEKGTIDFRNIWDVNKCNKNKVIIHTKIVSQSYLANYEEVKRF